MGQGPNADSARRTARCLAARGAVLLCLQSCAAAPPKAAMSVQAHASAHAPELPFAAVPDDAQGPYYGPNGQRPLWLQQIQGRTFLIWSDVATAVRVEPSATGFILTPPPAAAPSDSDALPSKISLFSPRGNDARWTLGDDDVQWAQWRDAFASKVTAARGLKQLRRVDDRAVETLALLRKYTKLLRERPADGLRAEVANLDPAWVVARGGVISHVTSQLDLVLDELRPSVSATDVARFERYTHALPLVVGNPAALWPASDDLYLEALAKQRLLSNVALEIRDGSSATLARDTPGRAGCTFGLVLPDPTANGSQPSAPFSAPEPGTVGVFPYLFLVFETGDAECKGDLSRQSSYPVDRGSFPFRLFANPQGEVVGAQIVGYMFSEIFVAPDIDPMALGTLLRANRDEISHQAE